MKNMNKTTICLKLKQGIILVIKQHTYYNLYITSLNYYIIPARVWYYTSQDESMYPNVNHSPQLE